MIIINTKDLISSSLDQRKTDPLKDQDFSYLLRAAENQVLIRLDAAGHFYTLDKPDGILSQLINLVIKIVKERSFSVFYNQDEKIAKRALLILNDQYASYEKSIRSTPKWEITKTDQKKLAELQSKKTKLKKNFETSLEKSRKNLDTQLQKGLQELEKLSDSKIIKYHKAIKAGTAFIKKLNQLKKEKESTQSDTLKNYLYSLLLDSSDKKIEDYSLKELQDLIEKSEKKLKLYQRKKENQLALVDKTKRTLQVEANQTYLEHKQSLENSYYIAKGDFSQLEREVVSQSREQFKKEQKIDETEKRLATFQVELDTVSRLHLAPRIKSTFNEAVARLRDQTHYLHTMVPKAIDTSIEIEKAPKQKALTGTPEQILTQVRKNLEKIKKEFSKTTLDTPEKKAKKALVLTAEVKSYIQQLDLLQKETPSLRRKITNIRQFILTQIAPLPRMHLEFSDIYTSSFF